MAKKTISAIQHEKYKKERVHAAEKLEQAKKFKDEQTDNSDASENSARDQAIEDIKMAEILLAQIDEYLSYEVTDYDKSEYITEGSLVYVQNEVDEGVYLLSSVGDPILDRVINVESALGKRIIGNIGGDVTVNGIKFKVTKIVDDKILEEFSSSSRRIEDLFR